MKLPDVDLNKFTGRWYVIACIPTFIERNAYNAVEQYGAARDGKIQTVFTFNEGAPDGKLKTYTPTAYVSAESNAVWGMQFIWPFKAEYRIAYVDLAYTHAIIARSTLDYVWIMSRSPIIDAPMAQDLVDRVAELGYDTEKLRWVPHDP